MGAYIYFAVGRPNTGYDKIKIYRSEDGNTFTLHDTIDYQKWYYDETGSSSYYYKYSFYNSTTTEETDTYNFGYGIENKIASVEQVATLLNVSKQELLNKFPDTPERILQYEDYVENVTKRKFRETKIVEEYCTPVYRYDWDGWVVSVKYFPVKEWNKIEVWNGNEWRDILVDYPEESRKGYWWSQKEKGLIFLYSFFSPFFISPPSKDAVRVSYTTQEYIPHDIQRAVILLTAISLLENEESVVMLPSGESQRVDFNQKIQLWKEEVNQILKRYVSPYIIDGWR
ncbi:MAG: hypothetical protein DRN30_02710 [Thermoplasmata archaeon]|nr:MAG: hypothetical protein DRN30_02710 [Thermoplasmata archaeon]